jgi:flagellar hook-length control protein FliK
MTPMMLPAASVSTTPAPAQPNAAGAAQPASTDFLLMLGQLVGAAAPAAAAPAVTTTAELRAATDDTAGVDDADVATADMLGALPISLPLAPTAAAVPLKAAPADMTLELQLSREPAAARVAMLAVDSQATTELTTPQATEGAAPQIAFDGVLSAQAPADAQQPVRVAASGDSAVFSRPVQTPVGSAEWADEIGSRLTLMAEQGRHTASLRLAPEHLGPLEIRIAIRDDQASVWFGAAHADTRAAIEHALPRLRELFASQGMSLADAGVFHEPPREQAPEARASGASPEAIVDDVVSPAPRVLKLGLVDAYA